MFDWAKALGDAVSTWIQSWGERKRIEIKSKTQIQEIKANTEAAVELARLDRLKNAQVAEIEWDLRALKNAETSWKDEAMTLAVIGPYIASFFPATQEYVKKGFDVLTNDVPDWYILTFGVVVAASFGYRGIVSAFNRFGPTRLKL